MISVLKCVCFHFLLLSSVLVQAHHSLTPLSALAHTTCSWDFPQIYEMLLLLWEPLCLPRSPFSPPKDFTEAGCSFNMPTSTDLKMSKSLQGPLIYCRYCERTANGYCCCVLPKIFVRGSFHFTGWETINKQTHGYILNKFSCCRVSSLHLSYFNTVTEWL